MFCRIRRRSTRTTIGAAVGVHDELVVANDVQPAHRTTAATGNATIAAVVAVIAAGSTTERFGDLKYHSQQSDFDGEMHGL